MDKIIYVCTGSCKAIISEKRYREGLVKCGAKACNKVGHDFERRYKCWKCGELYKEGQTHNP